MILGLSVVLLPGRAIAERERMSEGFHRVHRQDPERADEQLDQEAKLHFSRSPQLQVVAAFYQRLRDLNVAWWSPEFCRSEWPTLVRMQWLRGRPDLRQRITATVTGLRPAAARKRTLEAQAELIDAVVDAGDVSVAAYEEAFDTQAMVIYGTPQSFWAQFRERMPWEDDSTVHQEFAAWAIRQFLSDRSEFDGTTRQAILTPHDVRSAVDARLWQERIPLDVRSAVDAARLRQEKARPREPFSARHELGIVTPEIITAHIPLEELTLIFAAAERSMGLLAAPEAKESLATQTFPRPLGARWSSVVPRPASQSFDDVPSLRLSRVG